MSKDDMHVVAYKVLRYVYACNKRGVDPDPVDIYNLTGVNKRYLNQILDELTEKRLMKGYSFHAMRITLDGEIYLKENSAMKKVKDFLGAGFDKVLDTLL
ncbi:YjcQ family protein [Erysipelotrichaceae bacterium 66-17]